jgi:hypothetical protein
MMNMKLKWIITVVLLIIFSAIIITRFAHNRDLPEKLHGVWETSETKYTNRYFRLDKNAIGFGTGDGKIDWYEITRVDETVRRNKTLYTIEFKNDEDTVFKRLLHYNSENGGKIRFENQANIEWVLVNS